jgi:4-oxalomesaconate tautomerase
VHQAIGVLGAASVAAACCIPGTVARDVAGAAEGGPLEIEHPTGRFTVDIEIGEDDGRYTVRRSALLRTARKLMQGTVFVHDAPETTQ